MEAARAFSQLSVCSGCRCKRLMHRSTRLFGNSQAHLRPGCCCCGGGGGGGGKSARGSRPTLGRHDRSHGSLLSTAAGCYS